MSDPIRVFIAEDNADVRSAVVMLLSDIEDVLCIGEADSVTEIVSQAGLSRADVILLDVELQGQSSLRHLPELKRQLPTAQFLMYTNHSNPELIRGATAAGASGYILKTADFDDLLNAIRSCRSS